MHTGIIHYIINNLVIYQIGKIIEEEYGHVKMLLLYIISGIYGWILSSIFLFNSISVGSSPAIFGILGALFADLLHNYNDLKNAKKWFMNMILNLIFSIIISLNPYIDNWSHIGGLISGFLFGCIFYLKKKNTTKYSNYIKYLSMILLISIFIISINSLHKLDIKAFIPYKWYDNINCVDIGLWDCTCKAMNIKTNQQIDIHC